MKTPDTDVVTPPISDKPIEAIPPLPDANDPPAKIPDPAPMPAAPVILPGTIGNPDPESPVIN
jgi:hypothetical protein